MSGYLALMLNGEKVTLAEVDTDAKGPSLETMQGVVAGLIEPVFTMDSPTGKGLVTGYANEESLCLELPMGIMVLTDEFQRGVAGNMIITGLTQQGNTRSLTDEEIKWFRKRIVMVRGGTLEVFMVDLKTRYIK